MKTNKTSKSKSAKTNTPTTAPVRAQEQLDTKKPLLTPELALAEQLNGGIKMTFPKGANAVRAKVGDKATVVLKADVDTLKGVGVTTAEFGWVPNDGKARPVKEKFEPVAAPKAAKASATTPKPAKVPVVSDGNPYPRTKLRGVLFAMGQKPFKTDAELCERTLAVMTDKAWTGEKTNADQVKRGYAVVIDPAHRFNSKRSKLDKAADGTMTIVAVTK